MGSLFRSQQMVLCQIFLQNEAVYSSVSNLGELGLVQFRDTNATVSAFQRKFITQVRRCDEMERKLTYVESEIIKDGIRMDEVESNPLVPQPKEIIDLESMFERLETELKEVNSNSDALKKTYFELTELKNVLIQAHNFFADEETQHQVETLDQSTLVANEVSSATPSQHGKINIFFSDEDVESVVIKTVMKSHIFGIITGIQKFSRKTIYSVDDGTGTLDCVLWHNESTSTTRIGRCLSKLNSENAAHNGDSDELCREFLNKVQVNEEEFDYIHGDRVSCLGLVKLVKGKLLMDVNHHCKAENMNAESLWILDVLFCHKHLK